MTASSWRKGELQILEAYGLKQRDMLTQVNSWRDNYQRGTSTNLSREEQRRMKIIRIKKVTLLKIMEFLYFNENSRPLVQNKFDRFSERYLIPVKTYREH